MSILFLMLFGIPACATDFSRLSFNIGSYDVNGAFSNTMGVGMILTDPFGRKGGKNPFTGESYVDIPNMGVGMDSVDDYETGQPGPGSMDYSVIPAVTVGEYVLSVFGVSSGKYWVSIKAENSSGDRILSKQYDGYSLVGSTDSYTLQFDPTPGALAPVVTRTITFGVLRRNVLVARQLNQLGDDKFVRSLVKTIDLGEKLSDVCDKRRHGKDKPCQPAIAVLKLFAKRLEKANHKCDGRKPQACNEDKDWDDFEKDHRKDHDYDDFFKDWDRDDWHKWKNKCKRFVTDEAFKIFSEDTNWLIESLGGVSDKDHETGYPNKKDNHDSKDVRAEHH